MKEKKVAIVTGGSRGIGRAIAIELSEVGYYVIITYKSNDQTAQETIDIIKSKGSKGEKVRFDVSDTVETKRCMKEICSRFKNIQVLVNNAGVVADDLFIMMSEEGWKSRCSRWFRPAGDLDRGSPCQVQPYHHQKMRH